MKGTSGAGGSSGNRPKSYLRSDRAELANLFASVTAHATALLQVFVATAAAIPAISLPVVTLLLCYSLGIMGILTPYATGPSPIYFGSGYVPGFQFWRLGAILGAIYLIALLAIGIPYLNAVVR